MNDGLAADIAALHARGCRGQGIAIGHLDTGIDGTHPALAGRIAGFRVFAPGGFDSAPANPLDTAWHGTHTAGLLVGGACEGRPIGIAPEARLYAGVVIEEGNVVARTLLGLDWLAACDVRVVSLSFGVPAPAPVFRSLVRVLAHRDVLVVCPIGNSGAGAAHAPGIYPEVLAVGSADRDGRVLPFSGSAHDGPGRACRKPDVVACGVDVPSLAPGGATQRLSGTSVSSAIVAGIAALLRQAHPHAPADAVKQALLASCTPLAADQPLRARRGRIDVLKAFEIMNRGSDHDEASSGEPTILQQPPARYVDPRLRERLDYTSEDSSVDAVIELASFDGARAMKDFLLAENASAATGWGRVTALTHAPIVITRCQVKTIRGLLSEPAIVVASACDMDRSMRPRREPVVYAE